MEDKMLLDVLERIGNDCKFVVQKMGQDKMNLLLIKGEIRRLEDLGKKLKEENEILKQNIEISKNTANSIIEIAKEEAKKVEAFTFKAFEEARANKAESEKIVKELRLQKQALKV